MVILRPQAVDDLARGFEAIPVDTGHAHCVAARIDDQIAAGVPISGALGKGAATSPKN